MKKLFVICLLFASSVMAQQQVKVYYPYSPANSGTPALLRIVDEANTSQNIYKFLVEFKPGGNQIIAVKSLDETSLAIIAPAYVENVASGKLNENDYVALHSLGDACWVGISNGDIKKKKELTVGGVGFGNASHLTALALGEKYKIDVRYIVFKSNNDALINMTGNHGIDFVIDKYESYATMKSKNPNLNAIAASCPTRLPQEPKLKTFKELGIESPYVFNTFIASKDMPMGRRVAIANILQQATAKVGEQTIFELSALRPPQFYGITAESFHQNTVTLIKKLQAKYKDKITQQ